MRAATSPVLLLAALLVLATGASAALAAPPRAVPGSASPAEFVPDHGRVATKSATGWRWSASARAWSRSSGILPAALVNRGSTAKITRFQFISALGRLEQLRAQQYGTPRLLADTPVGASLPDVRSRSLAARAVKLGWIAPIGGRFQGGRAITANDAALAMTGVLGMRRSTAQLAMRLRREVPGVRTAYLYASAHALNRTLGLRWNVKDPDDELELGPSEGVNVAHGAYMLHVAGTRLDGWRLDEAARFATEFDLPALGANQARILRTAVKQLGQPYVWAGETEGRQAEGHGGFDCSGFTIRVVNQSGVPSSQLAAIGERTTYTQSAIPRSQRITRAKLRPGDAMYFGERGPRSTPSQNYHAGVYMGNGWFIHSSGGNAGVAIDSLDGWWAGEYSWGRRALRRP